MTAGVGSTNGDLGHVRYIPFTYEKSENDDSHPSARKLINLLDPTLAQNAELKFVRFTDGITNTLLKVVPERPGASKAELDAESILLRAYGNGTDVLIDREREARNHELLMKYDLAPALLARFDNGMLYRYISGVVANHEDLREPTTLSATARRLAQWHATVPCIPDQKQNGHSNGSSRADQESIQHDIDSTAPGKPPPNVWTTMHKWILALPTATEAQKAKQALLLKELKEMVEKLSQRPGLGKNGLVFAHCDLLCANIIMHKDETQSGNGINGVNGGAKTSRDAKRSLPTQSVSFIDYEYGTPSPAAFDIANHFAEWAGYECDYTMVPTRAHRRAFISEYIRAYIKLSGEDLDQDEETRKLFEEVDVFRGVPGFYWGIWSSIQAQISEIDFDYANYAEERLGEYWAYKAEAEGTREKEGKVMPMREMTWAKDE